MRKRTKRVSIWVGALFLAGVAMLIFSHGNTVLIGLGISMLPLLLLWQAWAILSEPHDGKEFPEDQWYEK